MWLPEILRVFPLSFKSLTLYYKACCNGSFAASLFTLSSSTNCTTPPSQRQLYVQHQQPCWCDVSIETSLSSSFNWSSPSLNLNIAFSGTLCLIFNRQNHFLLHHLCNVINFLLEPFMEKWPPQCLAYLVNVCGMNEWINKWVAFKITSVRW